MSSIDREDSTARAADRFFREHLVPAAERLRGRGLEPLDVATAGVGSSAFVPFPPLPDPFYELDDLEALGAALRELWEREGLDELAALVEPLMDLARELEMDDAESADVSPFLYVLF